MKLDKRLVRSAVNQGLACTGISAIALSVFQSHVQLDSFLLISICVAVSLGDFGLSTWNQRQANRSA